MTYDRNYSWTKEFNEYVIHATVNSKFQVDKEEKIDIQDIKLPFERSVKIRLQKLLNKIGFMNYGQAFGSSITCVSDNPNEVLKFKGWCLSDHVIGLEIEYKNIDNPTLNSLKLEINKQFNNYEVIWTEL